MLLATIRIATYQGIQENQGIKKCGKNQGIQGKNTEFSVVHRGKRKKRGGLIPRMPLRSANER